MGDPCLKRSQAQPGAGDLCSFLLAGFLPLLLRNTIGAGRRRVKHLTKAAYPLQSIGIQRIKSLMPTRYKSLYKSIVVQCVTLLRVDPCKLMGMHWFPAGLLFHWQPNSSEMCRTKAGSRQSWHSGRTQSSLHTQMVSSAFLLQKCPMWSCQVS